MQPEELLESALSRLAGLEGKVFPLEGLKNANPPFVFYLQIEGDEKTAMDGLTGLLSASFEIHCVGRSYAELKTLANRVRPVLQGLQGAEAPGLSVQRAVVRQASPDLKEREVPLYRRMYVLELDYQEE